MKVQSALIYTISSGTYEDLVIATVRAGETKLEALKRSFREYAKKIQLSSYTEDWGPITEAE